MRYSETYTFTIGKQPESIRLRQSSDGLNAIAAIGTDNLGGSLYDIKQEKSISVNSYIKLIQESIRGTEFKANTVDVLITDIYDANNRPLFYKAFIRRVGYESVTVNGKDVTVFDDIFLYSEENGVVAYKYPDGRVDEIKDEFYPVFINSTDASLRFVLDADGKAFEVGDIPNGEFSLYVRANNLSYKTKDNAVLKIRQYNTNDTNSLNIYVGPYSYLTKVQDEHRTYDLEYKKGFPDQAIVRAMSEVASIDGSYIVLKNNNLFDFDIEVQLIDSLGRVIKRIDNSEGIFNARSVFLKSGKIYSPDLIIALSQYEYSKISVNYNYVKYLTNNVSIDLNLLDDMDYISVGITPDRVSIEGNHLNYGQTIKYFVFNKMGFIEYQNGTQNLSSYQRITGYGFGEKGYGEHGYSGHIEEPGTIEEVVRTAVKSYNKSGYSEGYFSFGPFGGSLINTVDGLASISLEENSSVGYIELCRIYKKDLRNTPIVINTRKSIPNNGTHGLREIKTVSNSVFSLSLEQKPLSFLNAGVVEILSPNSTKASLVSYSKDEVHSTYKIDYKNDISKDIPEFVDDEVELSFKKDSSRYNFEYDSKYNLYGYSNGLWEVVEHKVRKSIKEEKSIYIQVDNRELLKYDFIGVAYGNALPGRKVMPWEILLRIINSIM